MRTDEAATTRSEHFRRIVFVLILFALAMTFFGAQRIRCKRSLDSGGGGGGGGPTATPVATHPPTPTNTPVPTPAATPIAQYFGIAPYTYKAGNCGQSLEIDPINVVFTNVGGVDISQALLIIYSHAIDHGIWGNHDGSDQSFWQAQDGCRLMDGQSASGGNLQLPGRFHMRLLFHSPTLLSRVAVADAHHEDIGICDLVPKHVVDHNEDNGNVSGFDMGRNDIMGNWIGNGHVQVDYAFWENINRMKQCDFDSEILNYSSSDGYVVFISIDP